MTIETPNPVSGQSLPDIQNNADKRGIGLLKAGVKEVTVPFVVQVPGEDDQTVSATVSFTVGLAPESKGVNMSRFMAQLTEWSMVKPISLDLGTFLSDARELLESETAFVEFSFPYYVKKAAPVTGIKAPMSYDLTFKAALTGKGDDATLDVTLGMGIVVANCCPCSKAISEYGAHNQRAKIDCEVKMDISKDLSQFSIRGLIEALEESASCPVFPILKRPDEKWVTERQYDNPKFVEDVCRDGVAILRKHEGIVGFDFEIQALESIHAHNAWAKHVEGM